MPSIAVHQFPCLSDNYGFLMRDEATGRVACVDTPDPDRIRGELRAVGWGLDLILNTHWHPDHAGGNEALQKAFACISVGPEEVRRVAHVDRQVRDGDIVMLGATEMHVIDVGGHTLGHIAFHLPAERIAFVGDALFPLGCGRIFEGTPEQMWRSLARLAALPEETAIYSAHEYTEGNARFALSIDDAPAVRERAEAVFAARAQGVATVPTLIGVERATNPFLRAPQLAARLGLDDCNDAEAFAAVRRAKDEFKG